MSGVKIYFLFLVVALAFSCNSKKEQKPAERPNIIFIMADDHAYQAISAYGEGLNETPNIDRIAKEGAIFTRATVTNSICAPSRAVLLTGKHSFMNGKVDNIQPFDWDQDNFPKLMQANGYTTALIGKIHLDGQPQGFDYSMVLPGQGEYYNPDFLINGEKKRIEGYVTDITTDLALDWLENGRDKEKPFVLLYHQKAPHRNWKPAPEYLTLYDDKEFTPPANFFDEETNYQGRGSAAREQKMEIDEIMRWGRDLMLEVNPNGDSTGLAGDLRRFNPEQLRAWREAFDPKNTAFLKAYGQLDEKTLSLEKKREIATWKYNRYIKNYLRTIKSVDDGVGEVLDYLEANGLAENTIVVYTSDQGFYLGEHGWFDKRFMYEESFRTPLLVKFPKEIKPGTTIKNLVQNLDFAPTFLDYAGIKAPVEMQGESFRKLVSGESKEWRDAVYYTYYEYPAEHSVKRHNGVATDRYKLIHFYYDIDEWELYDLEKDPREMRNVYDDPSYTEVREMMHKKFVEVREKYGDSDANDKRFLDEYMEVYNRRNSK
ncbi:sulfatase [Algoriphagus aquimarinus]|uniref:sulfatase family protein n=1 Tax=Algoriphagus aquimarinus TaxID=237018 RepID=UPI0030D6F10D|tara:strand:- start:2821 stop:4449 length:1629 start_codon:yes stop_codon:yes gene_type:complete